MNIIAHRRNTLAELDTTPPYYGVEMDIRSYRNELVVHHEPFARGPLLSEWLEHFHHGTLILNVKEEGLEPRVLELVERHGIGDYFFLDQSFPFLLRTARDGNPRCAVRLSEYESIHTVFAVADLVRWVWVDCFTRFPINGKEARLLQAAGFSLCLVSPELEGRDAQTEIPLMRNLLRVEGIHPEAVCTKHPDLWEAEDRDF